MPRAKQRSRFAAITISRLSAQQRPHGYGSQERCKCEATAGLGTAQDVAPVQRNKRVQAEKNHRSQDHDYRQPDEVAPLFGASINLCYVLGDRQVRVSGRKAGQLVGYCERHHQNRQCENDRSASAEGDQNGSDYQRPIAKPAMPPTVNRLIVVACREPLRYRTRRAASG